MVVVDHWESIGVWPCWVMQSWLTPSHVPSPSRTAKTGGLPWVHCLHSASLLVRVRRVEAHDHRVDLAAVDAAGIVDLVHEEVDRLRLLPVLGVGLDLELTLDAAERDQREDHVDGAGRDAPRAGAGLGDRRRGAGGAPPARPDRGPPRSPGRRPRPSPWAAVAPLPMFPSLASPTPECAAVRVTAPPEAIPAGRVDERQAPAVSRRATRGGAGWRTGSRCRAPRARAPGSGRPPGR